MEGKIVEEMKRIDDLGGMVRAVSSGYVQREVARQAYEFERGVQSGELLKVGVNIYADGEEEEVALHEYQSESAENQIQGLKQVKRSRNSREVTKSLKSLEKVVRENKNVMPSLLECCRAYATVGEMTGVFREVFGEFREPSIF
jgi:methylmalonyl-CoA mutase N-terminal domain/subunit